MDKVANVAAASGEAIGATVTRDVVTATHVASLNHLQDTGNTAVGSNSISDTRTGAGFATSWMGGSSVDQVVNPAVDLRIHNAGTEGSNETSAAVIEASEKRMRPLALTTGVQR